MLPRLPALLLWSALTLLLITPRTASADIGGKNYFTIVMFLDFFNTDCFQFTDDNDFIASFGLITGEWSEESIFFFSYYEVEIESPENPVYTMLDFMGGRFIAGKIETDDGDSGFFAGIESERVCAYPARQPGNKSSRKTVAPTVDEEPQCCGGGGLYEALTSPADASRPMNTR
ncbi:hypothetical protein GC163_17845 [bacterium]|nr:hypothetical protein [bacterium]